MSGVATKHLSHVTCASPADRL